jgi:hypothetical protein
MDHSDKTIFSIHMGDYFLLNEEMEIEVDAQTGYSKEETIFIANKIRKLERNSPNMVSIPCINLKDSKVIIDYFISLHFLHPEIELIKKESVLFDSNIRSSLLGLFDKIIDETLKAEWKEFLFVKADQKINEFVDEIKIDLHHYRAIWLGKGKITVTKIVEKEGEQTLKEKYTSFFYSLLGVLLISIVLFLALVVLTVLFWMPPGK